LKSLRKDLKAIASNPLVGCEVEITNSTDPGLIGLHGRIVDETLKTLVLETAQGEKKISKSVVELLVHYEDGDVSVNGDELLQRPEDRLKKLWKKAR